MVDFDNEVTISTPAVDIVRVLVLQRHNDLLEALETYNKMVFQNSRPSLAVVKARLYSLYYQLENGLKRGLKKEEVEKLEKQIKSKEADDIIKATCRIGKYLDDIRLTRLDTKKVYDQTDVTLEDQEKGL